MAWERRSTVRETPLAIACWIGADLLLLELIWENPPSISAPCLSLRGYHGHFQRLRTPPTAAVEAVGHVGQQLQQAAGSLGGGFAWSPAAAGAGQRGHVAVTASPSPQGPSLHQPWSNPLWRAGPVSFASAPTPFIPPSSLPEFISSAAVAVTSATYQLVSHF